MMSKSRKFICVIVAEMIEHKGLALIKPVIKFKSEFLSMLEEYRAVAEDPYRDILKAAWTDFHMYIRQLEDFSKGRGLPHSYAPMTSFWMVQDDKVIVGESRLRHKLTPALKLEGGHIGYSIRPSQRRKGYGTRLLELTLEKAKELGLSHVLVTCNTDNIASAQVIQKNGGKLAGGVISNKSGAAVSHYWIDL